VLAALFIMIDDTAVRANMVWLLTMFAPITNWVIGLVLAGTAVGIFFSLMKRH